MITVISGTNRVQSKTKLVAEFCYNYLREASSETIGFLDLVDINLPILHDNMYENSGQQPVISDIQDKLLIPSDHWLIVSPEYNGSFPGALKLLIDAISVRKYKETFGGKRATLLGLSSGRAGNFRGMEHLTGVLNYLNVIIMPNKLPISSIEKHIDENGCIHNETKILLQNFMDELLEFNKMTAVHA